ncbi:NAD(P)H-quinone oxidoreductase subunit 4L [Helianthus annuus]|uniref:NADH-ubiquinone oxidoreductase chain 4L/Mnh complex subunit C1 n=1 Tax=Helianthus annuus TaxID=4232 RepID=A0A9K3JQ72_HELAN|nr:putative NADH-ubiquinone oxidoreductase chain 4L/Mnh complex subunit C1 [Helianthus annuus]KAJ0605396.1 NAD(P)H-quinone oxidoreductase subunit 4L [Helianthus annuus]KAJ0619417.1 NAD(P)H-quinone oxidoreductase subunit 4L [Helianthus annuus]KAJ0940715.1 NAD(P)H-quinone oxidoreductase subunit 4L [Helianthus annuus]KAJ0952471.1 NAD(P)H-quinone oxidoreductase subunit 4L [Helianthus annuus]
MLEHVHVLVLSAYLFSVGVYRLIASRNMVRALMCLEFILNAVNLNFVIFSDFFYSF